MGACCRYCRYCSGVGLLPFSSMAEMDSFVFLIIFQFDSLAVFFYDNFTDIDNSVARK